MNTMKKILGGLALYALPAVMFAQGAVGNLSNVDSFIKSIGRIVGLLLPLVVAIGLLGFFWGLAQFIFSSGDPKKQDEGKSKMIWGVITLFVMVSVWGLVKVVGDTLGVGTGAAPAVPSVQNLPTS